MRALVLVAIFIIAAIGQPPLVSAAGTGPLSKKVQECIFKSVAVHMDALEVAQDPLPPLRWVDDIPSQEYQGMLEDIGFDLSRYPPFPLNFTHPQSRTVVLIREGKSPAEIHRKYAHEIAHIIQLALHGAPEGNAGVLWDGANGDGGNKYENEAVGMENRKHSC